MPVAWYKSRRGWITTALAVATLVLDQWGRLDAARDIYGIVRSHWPEWSRVSPFIAPGLFVLALLFFQLDRRIKPYDLNTLKGRTLQLRDKLQQFSDDVGPFVLVSTDNSENIAASLLHSDKLIHGYDLRFAADVRRIYDEFGERGVHDAALDGIIDKPKTQDRCLLVIAALSRLAEQAESGPAKAIQ